MNTDKIWETYGANNPYYGVIADKKYRGKILNEDVRAEFFTSGYQYVDYILSILDRHFSPCARNKALDFGCGTGRLAIPLPQRFNEVVGVDISTSMLRETAANASRMQVNNLRLCQTLSDLDLEQGTFSFVNTIIVLQHIAPKRGLHIVGNMLDLLEDGGCGALHMTYARTKYQSNFGNRTTSARAAQVLLRPISAIYRWFKGGDPEMQMNAYSMNPILFQLQSRGIKECFSQFTDHGGYLGITLYFSKSNQ